MRICSFCAVNVDESKELEGNGREDKEGVDRGGANADEGQGANQEAAKDGSQQEEGVRWSVRRTTTILTGTFGSC